MAQATRPVTRCAALGCGHERRMHWYVNQSYKGREGCCEVVPGVGVCPCARFQGASDVSD